MSLTARSSASLGWMSPTRMSCPSPRLLRVAWAWRARAWARRCSSSAAASRSSSSDPRAGEVPLLSRGCGLVVLDLLLDEAGHERWVDNPDAVGEVATAIVDEGVAAVARAVADLRRDAELEGASAVLRDSDELVVCVGGRCN
jgi:hypothetical protein